MKYELSAPLPDFLKMLKALVKYKRKLTKEMVLSWSDGTLAIDLPDSGIEIPASGEWPSAVRVRGEFLLRVARVPPVENPVCFSVKGERLWISRTSFPCKVDVDGRGSASRAPINSTHNAQLDLIKTQSEESALNALMPPAEKQAGLRREDLIARAAELLSPLGVGQQDLEVLVGVCFRRKQNSASGS